MAIMLKQYLDRFAAIEKRANETLSATPEALVGVDSLPGSEHDAKVPEEAKKPDEEVTQGQPSGATSTQGAVSGGDAKPLEEGKLEVDEPLLNAEQKPLVTDDALTAKEASDHLASLVSDLLKDIKSTPTQKQAAAPAPAPATATAGDGASKTDAQKSASEGDKQNKIVLDKDMLDKIAAAQAAFMAGRSAAEAAIKKASEGSAPNVKEEARKLIKDACVKAAQEAGLNPEEAAAAADNAMAAAGVPPEAAAEAAAAAPEASASAAAPEAAAAEAAAGGGLPDDVTEEELATALVDLVASGELDQNTAKALVEEIAGDSGAAAPAEDQAAEIIAQGLESGQITPEQAQEIAAAVEGGAEGEAAGGAPAGEADPEAIGAADAEKAIQDAQDEAQGEADAEEAMKSAAAQIRANAIQKVANKVMSKRAEKQAAAKPGSKLIQKVAAILQKKKEAIDANAQKQAAQNDGRAKYLAGFKKKAEEMGVDPAALARYVIANSKK